MRDECKKAKWLSGEALQIAVKRRDAKSKGEKHPLEKGKATHSSILAWRIPETV